MRPFLAALALALAGATPASAECAADVAALFTGGPLDPFERPNRREVTVIQAPDGSVKPALDVRWDGVDSSINCAPTGCTMVIGQKAWMGGASFDGPWSQAPTQLPDDPKLFARAIADDMAANITESACFGEVQLDGRPALKYGYRTKTNPNEYDSWFGGLFTVWIDVATGRLLRMEQTESISSWSPEPSPEVRITTVSYDETITISPPAE